MSEQDLSQFSLPNGLTLLVERLTAVESAAVTLTFPAGVSLEPNGKNGVAALLSEIMLRGAGDLDSRQLSIALDQLGLQYSLSPGWYQIRFSAATIADKIEEALQLIATVLLRPQFDPKQFEMCVVGREQALRSLEDDLRQKMGVELRRRCYVPPFNRPLEGTIEHLDAMKLDDVVEHYERCCVPQGAILAIAGNVDPQKLHQQCLELFGDWSGEPIESISELEPKTYGNHIKQDSTQTQIGIGYPAVPYSHPDYYQAWAAVGILSGGMSSRLFTKVREERGLCYSIGASLNTLKDRARIFCYAGTTNERAQETLDVTLHELADFGSDISEGELKRCQARAKSSLIMQEESTMARSSAMVRDWFHLKRISTLAEISDKVDSLTVESVSDYVNRNPATTFQVLTLGPEPLSVQGEVDISEL